MGECERLRRVECVRGDRVMSCTTASAAPLLPQPLAQARPAERTDVCPEQVARRERVHVRRHEQRVPQLEQRPHNKCNGVALCARKFRDRAVPRHRRNKAAERLVVSLHARVSSRH